MTARGRLPNPDRELVAAVRAELAAVEPTRACCRAAERAGLGAAATGEAHSPAVARLAVRLGSAGPATAVDAPRAEAPAPAGATTAGTAAAPARVGGSGAPAAPTAVADTFDWDHAAEHCRLSWLRGLFLARGSLSVGFARTHLEFVVAPAEAPVLAARLASIGLPAAARVRRGRGVVTWKSSERVLAFLRATGAGSALLELEARGVARSLRGELNRLLNAEAANLERAVGASARQLEAIRQLDADGRLAAERGTVRSIAAARLEGPDATLGEIAAELGVTRSSVQRALERLERLALHPATDAPFGPVRRSRLPG
jgi:hypothetical protein